MSTLNLRGCSFIGQLPRGRDLRGMFNYSNNNFSYSIPDDTGNILNSRIHFFSISNNKLIGVILESMCNATFLKVLDLSSNNLSGRIQACLIEGVGIRMF